MPTIAARALPYLANVQNTAKGEGRNPAKYDDRDGVMVDVTALAEMPAYRYANGVNCPDDTGASTALILSIRLRASVFDGANMSEGLIYNGETYWVHYDNGVNSAWWRAICTADNYIHITVANLQYGVNPANYAGLVGLATVHVRVSNGGYWKLAATDLAVGIITGMINMQDAQVMKANSTSPTSGAGTYWTPATAAETAMNALCTSHDVGHDLAGNHRRVIGEAAMTYDALAGLKGNMIPDGWMHYFTGYAGGAKPVPLGWTKGAGALEPDTSAPYTTGTFGSKNEWDLKLTVNQLVFTRAMTGGNIAQYLTRFKGKVVRFVVVYKHNAGADDLTIRINDGVSSTDGLIDTSTAATYTTFHVDKIMSAVATDLYAEIINATGGAGGARGYIAFCGFFFLSPTGDYWIPFGDEYYEIVNLAFGFSAVAAGSFAIHHRPCDGAGDDPAVEGAIVGVHSIATFKTADATGNTDFSLYHCDAAGTEAEDATYLTRIPTNARVGRGEWTPTWGTIAAPTAAPLICAVAVLGGDYGSLITHKLKTAGGGTPAGARISDKIWIIKP